MSEGFYLAPPIFKRDSISYHSTVLTQWDNLLKNVPSNKVESFLKLTFYLKRRAIVVQLRTFSRLYYYIFITKGLKRL